LHKHTGGGKGKSKGRQVQEVTFLTRKLEDLQLLQYKGVFTDTDNQSAKSWGVDVGDVKPF